MGEQTHHSGRIQHSQCHWMNFNKIADVNFDELEHAWSKKEEEKKNSCKQSPFRFFHGFLMT